MPNPKNKKYIAQREKEERQKRIILIGTIAILVIVIGLVVYGLIAENVFKPNKPILELGSQSINTSEFKQRVRYQRLNMVNQAIQMYQYGMGDYVLQIANQLDPMTVGQSVLQNLQDELIILEEAEKMGIELTEEELEIEIQHLFGFYAEGTPTPVPTQEILPTSTLTSLQLTLVPDTATPTASPTVEGEQEEEEESPTATPTIMVEESEEESNQDPTATPILQPTEYTYEMYQENYQTTLDNLELEISMNEETLRNLVKAFLYRQEIMDKITTDISETQEHVWARHILLEDEENAQEVLTKLDEGGDFVELAKEYSTGPSAPSGGDLGWFTKDAMVAPFAEAAFDLDIGEISEPVETSFGWHIIQLLGREERTLDPRTLDQMRQVAFEEWLVEKRAEYEDQFVINEDWPEVVPTEPALPADLLQTLGQQQQP